MRAVVSGVLFVSGVLACGTTFADGMKPGQWEVTRSGGALANIYAHMQSMPPEMRKAMEGAMTSKDAGFAGNGGNFVNRVCLTPEQAANFHIRGNLDKDHKESNCKWQKPERTGQTVRVVAQCAGSRTEAVLHFSSDSSFTGSQTIWLEGAPAGPMNPMKEEVVGKWVGAKCGS